MKIKATYRKGVIEPLHKINLPEGQELEIEFRVLPKTSHELSREEKRQDKPIRLLSDRARDGGSGGYWKFGVLRAKNEREANC